MELFHDKHKTLIIVGRYWILVITWDKQSDRLICEKFHNSHDKLVYISDVCQEFRQEFGGQTKGNGLNIISLIYFLIPS